MTPADMVLLRGLLASMQSQSHRYDTLPEGLSNRVHIWARGYRQGAGAMVEELRRTLARMSVEFPAEPARRNDVVPSVSPCLPPPARREDPAVLEFLARGGKIHRVTPEEAVAANDAKWVRIKAEQVGRYERGHGKAAGKRAPRP